MTPARWRQPTSSAVIITMIIPATTWTILAGWSVMSSMISRTTNQGQMSSDRCRASGFWPQFIFFSFIQSDKSRLHVIIRVREAESDPGSLKRSGQPPSFIRGCNQQFDELIGHNHRAVPTVPGSWQ
jgi:hypothetical protein